jgi:hypothetical protein
MDMLEVKTSATGTMVIEGNWELRASSQGTEEWLGTSYPGSLDGFKPQNTTDLANGYDPAPKMALLKITLDGRASDHTISGTALNNVLACTYSQVGTKTVADQADSVSALLGAVGAADADTGKRDMKIELATDGGLAAGVWNVMLLYN